MPFINAIEPAWKALATRPPLKMTIGKAGYGTVWTGNHDEAMRGCARVFGGKAKVLDEFARKLEKRSIRDTAMAKRRRTEHDEEQT